MTRNNNFPTVLVLDTDSFVAPLLDEHYKDVHLNIIYCSTPVEALENFISNDIGLVILRDAIGSEAALDFWKQCYRMQVHIRGIVFLNEKSDPMTWMNLPNITLLRESSAAGAFGDILDKLFNELQRTRELLSFESEKEFELNFLKTILAEQKTFIAITDRSGSVIYMNRSGENFLGMPEQSMLEENLIDYLENGLKVWNYSLIRLGKRDTHFSKEFVFKNTLGELKPITLKVYEINDSRGRELIAFEGSINTEEKTERELAGNPMKLLERFAAGLANEILNPINVIQGRVQLIRSGNNISSELNRALEVIQKQSDRILSATERLVSFARLREDSVPQKILLNKIIENQLAGLANQNCTYHTKLDKNLSELHGLNEDFEIMIRNLLSYFSERTGDNSEIYCATKNLHDSEGKNFVRLSIEDNHESNIDDLKQQFLLPFYDPKSKSDTMGISLTLICAIAERYHGRIQVKKSKYGGASVNITFPVGE